MEQAVVEGTWGGRCVLGLWGRFWNGKQRLWKEVVVGQENRRDQERLQPWTGEGPRGTWCSGREQDGVSGGAGRGGGGDRRVPGHRPAEALGRSTMVAQALSGGVCGGAGLLLPRRPLSFPTHAKVT